MVHGISVDRWHPLNGSIKSIDSSLVTLHLIGKQQFSRRRILNKMISCFSRTCRIIIICHYVANYNVCNVTIIFMMTYFLRAPAVVCGSSSRQWRPEQWRPDKDRLEKTFRCRTQSPDSSEHSPKIWVADWMRKCKVVDSWSDQNQPSRLTYCSSRCERHQNLRYCICVQLCQRSQKEILLSVGGYNQRPSGLQTASLCSLPVLSDGEFNIIYGISTRQ